LSDGVSLILPGFLMVDRILDMAERDNAEVVRIVPAWPQKPWWQRSRSGAWRARVVNSKTQPANILTPYNEHCTFGQAFTTGLLALRIQKLQVNNTNRARSPGAGPRAARQASREWAARRAGARGGCR
jgi:hypothetical protein